MKNINYINRIVEFDSNINKMNERILYKYNNNNKLIETYTHSFFYNHYHKNILLFNINIK